ncbi:MAG: RNA polymerase factor sigma-54 [Gammaproteobacteria bacterium]|nr:RNA polymerase factor sigma-54 [Gammaproteobacteria bacterium]
MKQALTLKLGQQLTMTPQLQQAIRLLQLSTLELQLEVQQAIEANPMLELDDDIEDATDDPLDENLAETEESAEDLITQADGTEIDPDDADEGFAEEQPWQEAIPAELPVDTTWDDIYQSALPPALSGAEDTDSADRNAGATTLADHLMWQLNLTPMSDRDLVIATAIIDAIDTDGMLLADVNDIATMMDDDPAVEIDEVEAVLKLVQQFEPAGIAARSLQECLLLQLHQLPAAKPWRREAITLITEHIDLLGARDFAALTRKSKLDDDQLGQVIELIQSLNPRPGSSVGDNDIEYIEPDVTVRKDQGRWLVELNQEAAPRVRINPEYACLVRRADTSEENTYLRNNLQEAKWFLKSLQSRSDTLLKVATRIVEHQRGFLEYGEEAMKPLVLAEIAAAVEMHESTISRVTTRKYMHTPRGIFELKYFFSSHVGTRTGGEVSSTAIRALIKKLTADENPRKPLSDNKIAVILAGQNIKVARRTVAKYRESMSIPPSNERKRFM